MIYRRLRHSDVWHFNVRCYHWPKYNEIPPNPETGFAERKTKPTNGELCDQCRAKDRADKLEKLIARVKKIK